MTRILVVEDEKHIADGLRFNLEQEGHEVSIAETGENGLKLLLARKQAFDLLILDVMLPGKDGFAISTELRQAHNYIPLLMLTARGRPEDVLRGFEAGADDYLAKPFDLDILLARVNGLLRRKKWQSQPAAGHTEEEQYRFNGKLVDFARLQLRIGDKVYQLTVMELELLRYLIRNSGRPVSRKEILEQVWNLHEDTDTRAMDNFIVRLRRYIEEDPTRPQHLLTVRGLGYQFVPEPAKAPR
jgi:DNA-binding response OmpR family regulator